MEQSNDNKMLEYTYYPGCSVEATAVGYRKSTMAAMERLGIRLIELDDWNCCGATAYMSVRELMSFAIAGRNLALAEPFGRDIVTPCSACYLVLNKANHYFHEFPEMRGKIDQVLAEADLEYHGSLKVRHLFEVVMTDVGIERMKELRAGDLNGLKVACYYGCQMVRPYGLYDKLEFPTQMEDMVEAFGGEGVDFPMKVKCCGSSLIGSAPDVAYILVRDILKCAKEQGAECIITTCPLCQFNLDVYQSKVARKLGETFNIPILYFTQIIGLGTGIPSRELGFNHLVVSPNAILEKRGLLASVKK
jgi:heterodisulfide reductase subunit B